MTNKLECWITLIFMSWMTLSCASNVEVSSEEVIRIDGSSTLYPLTEAIIEQYRDINPQIRVTVGISGTGGGFEKFLRGETDISDASRPISRSERATLEKIGYKYLELPVAFDGIVVVVHPENKWCQSLTILDLKKLWEPEAQGRILLWKHLKDGWPDERINLFGPGVDSGTYDYFTRVITGKDGWSRGDFTSSEDDNILVSGIASDLTGLGFFSYVYYFENKDRLKPVPIDDLNPENGNNPVLPNSRTIGFDYQPLSRPVFLYIRLDSLDKPGMSDFVEFYVRNAGKTAREVGFVPLSNRVYERVLERLRSRLSGSVFNETEYRPGLNMEEMLSGNTG